LDFGGIINTDFDIIWQCKIPYKVQIFMWLVRKRKILTQDQLLRRGWDGNSYCVFCGQYEDIDHLLVQCPTVKILWDWITKFNNLTFNSNSLDDLWLIDCCLSLKDRVLIELIRGTICWIIWLKSEKCISITNFAFLLV
jgi:zinc-binding in reverse transcriptase